MSNVVIVIALTIGAYALVAWAHRALSDRALDVEMQAMQRRVFAELGPEDIDRLALQLDEIRAMGNQSSLAGMSPRKASIIVMRASMQTMAMFIEVDRMFKGLPAGQLTGSFEPK